MELYLPHAATWKQTAPRAAGEGGIDGGQQDAGTEVSSFWDPLSPVAAEKRYGVIGVDRPFLVLLDPEEADGIREGDVLERDGGTAYIVKAVRRFEFEETHLEVVVGGRTRGRQ
jgi:hypothetical protein